MPCFQMEYINKQNETDDIMFFSKNEFFCFLSLLFVTLSFGQYDRNGIIDFFQERSFEEFYTLFKRKNIDYPGVRFDVPCSYA